MGMTGNIREKTTNIVRDLSSNLFAAHFHHPDNERNIEGPFTLPQNLILSGKFINKNTHICIQCECLASLLLLHLTHNLINGSDAERLPWSLLHRSVEAAQAAAL
ncbi:MAG: hypothetical protein K0R67_1922 [Paenibacillus sp.]|nr:hypothetical protein [Paenibacillus sp.]